MTRRYAFLGVAVLLLLWTGGSLLVGNFIIPPPWQTIADSALLLAELHTWAQVAITLARVAAGFLLAFSAGLLVGLLSGGSAALKALFKPLILLLQGIPPLLWAIPLILVFGVGHLSPLLVIALICFPLVALNISEGMSTLPGELEQMLSIFAPGLRARLRELVIPHLKPFLSASVKLGIVLGIKASVVAEYFAADNGIGFQIQAAYQSLQTRRLFSWGLLLVGLIILADRLPAWLAGCCGSKGAGSSGRAAPGATGAQRALESLKQSFAGDLSSQGIRLEKVSFTYPQGRDVLRQISLSVAPDEIAVISGESGIGKTTLLYAASSLLQAGSGLVTRPGRCGFVFQDDRLLPWRNCSGNVALPLLYNGVEPEVAGEFAAYLLELVGLRSHAQDFPAVLSGGMKKRLCFARCFARFPEAVFLDEPFSGLHADARRRLWKLFFRLLELHRVPALIVTHFPEEVPCSGRCRFYTLSALGGEGQPGEHPQLSPDARFHKYSTQS
jgi:ABC-type nitrate/sulfonate/bicarbonate transport system ATPase subunit/ABC-type nitrate/sulfonate/bicarbonate transport system permease component